MISSLYLYLIFLSAIGFVIILFLFQSKPYKNEINNKILLKNLLEGLDLELPDELKGLEKTSTDPQKLSKG